LGQVQANNTRVPEPSIVVRATGDIDQAATDQLRRTLVRVIMHEPTRRIVIDLDGVTALDALTIGVLRAAATTAQDLDRSLVFHTSGSPVAERLRREGILDSRVAN